MNIIKINLISILMLLFTINCVQAQSEINSAGGNFSNSKGSVSYSIGQIFYTNYENTNISVAEGVQHPYEIYIVSVNEESIGTNVSISVFPNPVSDILTFNFESDEPMNGIIAYLYDVNGKIIKNIQIEDKQANINMSNLEAANYFLKIIKDNKELKTFKIIKH